MERKEYNGWTNYETWNCKLWLDNDEGSYGYWQEAARQCIDRNADRDAAVAEIAEILEEYFQEAASEIVTTGFFSDILTMALREVNWQEIAEHLIEDNVEEDDFQTEA